MAGISVSLFCEPSCAAEEWRGVPDSVGTYGVSDQGEIRSKRDRSGKPSADWRILKPCLDSHGCPYVALYLCGRRTQRLVSHLVADAFLPPKSLTDKVVRHLNDNPADNRAINLARGTYSDNAVDAFRNCKRVSPRGSAHYLAKLTEDDVREIRRLDATGNFSYPELALRFGVNKQGICKIVLRQTWKHVL